MYVGDVGEYLSVIARADDPTAFLLEHNNVVDFLSNNLIDHVTVYTSLGDLSCEMFYNTLLLADEIVYAPPQEWSDNKELDIVSPSSCLQGLTEMLLLGFSQSTVIKNIKLAQFAPDVIPLVDDRKSTDYQLWVAGCSITHGLGVEMHQRYGYILGKNLNLATSFLTRPGSSIAWAADQILRSDIRKDDIVVWGITSTERLTVIGNNKLLPGVTAVSIERNPEVSKFVSVKDLLTQTNFYENVYAIKRVLNYCVKVGANLLLFGVLVSDNMLRFLSDKQNFWYMFYKPKFTKNSITYIFKDVGTDNIHPGPIQHQQYADFCQSALKKLNYI